MGMQTAQIDAGLSRTHSLTHTVRRLAKWQYIFCNLVFSLIYSTFFRIFDCFLIPPKKRLLVYGT